MTWPPKIMTGVPVPKDRGFGRHSFLRDLSVGDSFVVSEIAQRDMVLRFQKTYGIKLTTRKIDGGGYRIWRVK